MELQGRLSAPLWQISSLFLLHILLTIFALVSCKKKKPAEGSAPPGAVAGDGDKKPDDAKPDEKKDAPNDEKKEKSKKNSSKKSAKKSAKEQKSKKEEKEKSKKSKKEEKEKSKKEKEKEKSEKKEAKEKSAKSNVKDPKSGAKEPEGGDKEKADDKDKKEEKKEGEADKPADDKKEEKKEGDKKEEEKKNEEKKDDEKKDEEKKDGDKKESEKKDGDKKEGEGTEPTPGADGQQTAMQLLKKEIGVEPNELRFSKSGGVMKLNLTNNMGSRIAVKIKCSDNALFRVNPVFSFVEKDAKYAIEISRIAGAAKPDKLAVVTIEVPDDAKDAQAAFKDVPADKQATVNVPIHVN